MGNSYRHLDLQERVVIETQLRLGLKPGAIAAGLVRARSSVLREMHRNGWKTQSARGPQRVSGGYRCLPAQRRAQRLATKPRVPRKLAVGTALWEQVAAALHQGLSPAQIARTLARIPAPVRLCSETIYHTLYAMPRGELRSSLLAQMRRKHHARRAQRGSQGPQKPPIPEMMLIDQRPSEVDERLIPGHWEGDLIIGQGNRSQVGVLVERSTLFVALVELPSGKADPIAQAFSGILQRFDSQLRRSMTFDQGSEMRHHQRLSASTGITVYFAHPHSPWERGICENTNGLLRQYLPKGTDLSLFSQEQLDDMAWSLNTRPRKTLGWKAPAELFLPQGAFDFVQYWSAKINPVALGP